MVADNRWSLKMKILELKAENFARLRAVEIRPDGHLVQVTGENSNGKTSVLNSIWTALKGRAVAPPVPVRKGAEEARIRLTLGGEHGVDATVTRTFGADDQASSLKVELAGGKRVQVKPQALIDGWLGSITIDPLKFARSPAREQFDVLKRMVPGVDFDELAATRKRLFDQRTDVNRRAKEMRTLADKIVLPPGKVPAQEPDLGVLSATLREALAGNSKVAQQRDERVRMLREAEGWADEAETLRARAAGLDKRASEQLGRIEKMPPLAAVVDTTEITERMESAQQDHRTWAMAQQRKEHQKAADAAEAAVKTMTDEIGDLDASKVAAIAKAKLPVKGLSLGDDMVLLNGLPFEQAGTAEKLRTSIAIGMADNPTLRVMLIDEGSELDKKSTAIVQEMAKQHDYQIWMARVEDGGKTGFVIVDGEVAP